MTEREKRLRQRVAVIPVGDGVSDEYNYLSLGMTRTLLDQLERARAERDYWRNRFDNCVDQHSAGVCR